MKLKNESKTLFIPLLGKAVMSKSNLFLTDTKACEIIDSIDYDFESLKQSKWLSMYMSVRALVIDELCDKYIKENPGVTVIHLGCGLDSRCLRVKQNFRAWYDIDYENVIEMRKNFYQENIKYKMIGSSVLDYTWLEKIEKTNKVLVIAEGLTMYLSEEEIKDLLINLLKQFANVQLLFDAYSKKGVRLSKIKNPVNQMKAEIKYGIDNEEDFLRLNDNLVYINSYEIKKDDNNLKGITRFIFNNLYCGRISQSLYKIYEFKLDRKD